MITYMYMNMSIIEEEGGGVNFITKTISLLLIVDLRMAIILYFTNHLKIGKQFE
jgi:hypothetical protein